jgi:hypothetical protein
MKTFMNLNRFEAFSDGVFAIAMTLLVIEIKVPDLSQATTSTAIDALAHTAPHILSYITSFLVIGVLWLNHHALFHLLKRVDRIALTISVADVHCFYSFPNSPDRRIRKATAHCDVLRFNAVAHWNCLQSPLVLCRSSISLESSSSQSSFYLSSFSLEYWLSHFLLNCFAGVIEQYNLKHNSLYPNSAVLSVSQRH